MLPNPCSEMHHMYNIANILFHKPSRILCYVICACLTVVALTSCADVQDNSYEHQDNILRIATTVSPITSLVENIGGNLIHLQGLIPEGVNSHTFEPSPSVASVLAQADLIVVNGLFLEEPTLAMAKANKRESVTILALGDKAITKHEWMFDFSFPEANGHPNPHLWTDPLMGLKYAELILVELVRLDPANRDYYEANFAKLKVKIEDLHQRIVQSVETIPPANRKLVTYHDSFPMFGARYGIEIVGAIQPSDFTEPSAKSVAKLIDQVKTLNVPSIFGSKVFPSPIMEQIAKEGGAEFIDQLRDDDLPGNPGDPQHTYLGLILSNMKIMIPALGGTIEAFTNFDPSVVFVESHTAIYPE
jgi:ABC-type Zn uptake system ZnuABC Zn-binding protein ZnuA